MQQMDTVEEALLERIVYIGEGIPQTLVTDSRHMFVLLGTPQELIDTVNNE